MGRNEEKPEQKCEMELIQLLQAILILAILYVCLWLEIVIFIFALKSYHIALHYIQTALDSRKSNLLSSTMSVSTKLSLF